MNNSNDATKYPVIGISGPSSSGKSSLAGHLAASLDAVNLCLDDYFIRESTRPVVNGYPSFEQPHQYDGVRLAADIKRAARSRPVIADGFLLFLYPKIIQLCDQRLFISIPDDVILERRLARMEEGHGKASEVESAFRAHGLAEWHAFGAQQTLVNGIVVLDGQRPTHELLAWAMGRIARDHEDFYRRRGLGRSPLYRHALNNNEAGN